MKRYTPVVGACGQSTHRIDYEERADGEFYRASSVDILLVEKRLQLDDAMKLRRLDQEFIAKLWPALERAAPHVCSLLCPSTRTYGEQEWKHVELCREINTALGREPNYDPRDDL